MSNTKNNTNEINTFTVGYAYYPHESLETETWIVSGTESQARKFLAEEIKGEFFLTEFEIFELVDVIKL